MAAILLGHVAALLSYAIALSRERPKLLSFARVLVSVCGALLLALTALLWIRTGRCPIRSLGGFLVVLSLAQIAFALVLDFWKGRRLLTMGAAFASLLNIAISIGFLAPGGHSPGEPGGSVLHIATFLVSYVAFDVLFISAFTSLMTRRLLKRKEGLWLLDVTPSLETSTRTARVALWVGLAAFTIGIVAGYLQARGAQLEEGWRLDATITLSTVTWLGYLVSLILGLKTSFRGRSFHISGLVSFGLLVVTLLGLLWSGFHRAA